jgi:hypothetical protein
VTLTVHAGTGTLDLPVRAPKPGDDDLPAFAQPETGPDVPVTQVSTGHFRRAVVRDRVTGEIVSIFEAEGGLFGVDGTYRVDPIDLVIGSTMTRRYAIRDDDPTSARAECRQMMELSRGDWRAKAETIIRMWSTKDDFHLEAEVDAYHGDALISSRRWSEKIPRKLV